MPQTPPTSKSRRLLELLEDGDAVLSCYHCFFNAKSVDLVEALLYTSRKTVASNALDYVYGVLGLSSFPARAMSLEAWSMAQDRASFLPIDYSIDEIILNCVLSRILLSKLGLGLLAKFKVTDEDDEFNKAEQDRWPSWVIDWRLAARTTNLDPNPRYMTIRRLDNAWDIQSNDCPDAQQIKNVAHVGRPKLFQWPRPSAHDRFCEQNDVSHGINIRALQVEGRICSRAIIDTTRRNVKIQYAREKRYQQISWHLRVQLQDDDIVVSFPAFARADYTMWMIVSQSTANGTVTRKPFVSTRPDLDTIPYACGGLWVLRSVQGDHFRLIACLSLIQKERFPPYEPWIIDEAFMGAHKDIVPLMVKQMKDSSVDAGPMKQEPYQAIEATLGELRTFQIV